MRFSCTALLTLSVLSLEPPPPVYEARDSAHLLVRYPLEVDPSVRGTSCGTRRPRRRSPTKALRSEAVLANVVAWWVAQPCDDEVEDGSRWCRDCGLRVAVSAIVGGRV